jgi:hypothetical protein
MEKECIFHHKNAIFGETDRPISKEWRASLDHFLKNFLFEGSSFLIDEFLNTE